MGVLKRWVIVSMFFAFVVLAGTGIIKFPEIQKYFLFVYNFLPTSTISIVHDWSGILLLFLIVIHLVLKRQGLKEAFRGILKTPERTAKTSALIISIIFLATAAVYAGEHFLNVRKPIHLSGIEVQDYQGEKLGSINDFRENSIKGPQYIDRSTYKLEIMGLVPAQKSYSYDDILKLPVYQKVVTINCVEGWSVKVLWEGVLVKDLLKNITIKPEAKTVIFYAADGYSTSFPLDYILQNNIIMASKLNGVELPPERGFPFQLVAEQKW